MTTAANPRSASPLSSFALSVAATILSTVVAAGLLCLGVAAIAHGLGASADFRPLTAGPLLFFIVLGTAVGTLGWVIIRKRSKDPQHLLVRLAPTVLIISLVPDVLVGISGSMPGTSWGAVIGLMVMHFLVAACLLTAFRVFLPAP